MLANFWRSVAADPDQVAHFADWPVSEPDLHARHRWLVETGAERLERIKTDPDFFDPKVAGWWVWGQCLWIGSGWCAGAPGERRPHLGGTGEGQGLIRVSKKLPLIAGGSKGVHADVVQKRPALTGNGGGNGVHKPSLHRLAQQVPDLSGDAGAAGRGIHASRFMEKSGGLQAYMRALSDRLRRVRVCCGDFERILGPAVTTCIGLTGVLLDPPYDNEERALCYNHDGPEESGRSVWWRAYQWAIDHGGDLLLRIALCGYEHPDATFPPGWTCVAWKASGGYGRSDRGKANARRERIWFSPHCLAAEQGSLW